MEKRTPIYQKIYSELRRRIIDGVFSAGDMFPSERVLRDEFQVSHLTVRKALSQLVKERLIERKTGLGTIVIHRNDGQRREAFKQIDFVSIIFEEADDYFSKILNLIEVECRKQDVRVVFYSHYRDEELMKRQYQRAAEMENSVILLFPATALSGDWLRFHPAIGRTVIVDDLIPNLDAPQIVSDDVQGMCDAVKYLAAMGHRKIAHVSSEAKTTGWNRIRGYRKAVDELGLADDPSLMENGSFISEASSFALEKIIKANPDCQACVCANDNAALGAMKFLRKINKIPGKDFSLVGYGNFDISEALELTSVDQQVDSISRQIMFLIDEYRAKGKMPSGIYTIPTELKIRNSCAAFK